MQPTNMQANSKGKKLTNGDTARAKESRQRAAHMEKQAEADHGSERKRRRAPQSLRTWGEWGAPSASVWAAAGPSLQRWANLLF
jgi:hypothetical protein